MKSKLFQRLADLPGINWFNRRDKMDVDLEPLPDPKFKNPHDLFEVQRMMYQYFSLSQSQRQYIIKINDMVAEFDHAIDMADEEHLVYEEEIKSSMNGRHLGELKSQVATLKQRVQQLEAEKANTQPIIKSRDIDKMVKRLDELQYHFSGHSKIERRARETHNALFAVLQKLQTHMERRRE